MDGLSFDGGGENSASCEADMMFIRGFNTWSPAPRCGNLTNYGGMLNREKWLSILLNFLEISLGVTKKVLKEHYYTSSYRFGHKANEKSRNDLCHCSHVQSQIPVSRENFPNFKESRYNESSLT